MSRLMTGARPTGGLHVGQYFAAFKPFVERRQEFDEAFFVVSDLHMLTTKFTPASTAGLRSAARRLTAEAIGFGINPATTTFYLQSSVQWQARIYVLLQSLAVMSQLEKHASFTEMALHSSHIRPPTLGLLGYPVLESSDVLSIAATHVTVGENNRSHFEQLAEILEELRRGWDIRVQVPEVITGRANLIGTDGFDKMSKSLNNAIFFADSPDVIARKVLGMAIRSAEILVPIAYLEVLGTPPERCSELEAELIETGKMTERVASELTERLLALVQPVDRRARQLLAAGDVIDDLLSSGCAIAADIGAKAYEELADGIGLQRL
jgi:tryptophanyl-tRNA synthetase